MLILKNIEIVNLALLIKDTLVISDIHIGYEEELNKKGIMIPRLSFNDITKQLEKILKKVKIKKIVITGDLKHEFGKISDQEWRETLNFVDFLMKQGEVILIKGNHDKTLDIIAKKRNVTLVDSYIIEDIILLHGDEIIKIPENINTIVMGHEHPAIALREDKRIEKYKCFLKGRYKNKNLIVLPSFNPVTIGTDILSQKLLSPFLKQDLSKFNVYVIADSVYDFGKVGDLK
tara:strand:+ start:241 stop:936 length:696 start_codon:yes stop_codon:yes gene_type:complete